MPVYPFRCAECGEVVEEVASIYDAIPEPECHGRMEQIICPSGVIYARTPGRDTGIYDLDYGKRATEDLTPPGKMERLKKEGRIKDPFDDTLRNSSPQAREAWHDADTIL
jgi:predicted nucleic acid-binding Zn ribbon protein